MTIQEWKSLRKKSWESSHLAHWATTQFSRLMSTISSKVPVPISLSFKYYQILLSIKMRCSKIKWRMCFWASKLHDRRLPPCLWAKKGSKTSIEALKSSQIRTNQFSLSSISKQVAILPLIEPTQNWTFRSSQSMRTSWLPRTDFCHQWPKLFLKFAPQRERLGKGSEDIWETPETWLPLF